MNYSIEKFKDNVVFIKVSNGNKMSAVFSNFGAGVYSLRYENLPLILEISDKETWLHQPNYYGKTLARVAGRIPVNGVLDGVPYKLDETMASYCLHGGDINSLSFKAWDYKVKEFANKTDVIFSITSRAKENGFPGLVKIKVIYELFKKNNNLKCLYKASTTSATLLNLSNHNYYNFLNSKDVSLYSLRVAASKYGVIDQTSFIHGVDRLPWFLDFSRLAKLNNRLTYLENKTWIKTIDNTFIFDEVNPKKPQVVLKSPEFKATLYTSYPTLNIFCDNFHVPLKFNQFNELDSGRRSLALEPQLFDYDLKTLELHKGEKYNHFWMIKFKDLRK
jgi:Galactose mutarotase and related enzymes